MTIIHGGDMKKEIKSRFSGSVLFSGEYSSLKIALESAVKLKTDLRGADLRGANLRGVYLRGVKGINKYLCNPLFGLFDQPGKIRAYKLVNEKLKGIYNGCLKYEIGKTISVEKYDTNENNECGEGINLATLDWCIREWKRGYKIIICEFKSQDIEAIPIATDGEFRVKKCKVIGEKDLTTIGL